MLYNIEYCMYCTVHSGMPWQPWNGFFAGITPPESLHIIGKVEGKGASEQFKERGCTHEPTSTTTTDPVGSTVRYEMMELCTGSV